ncbi:BDM_1a_G0044610.mRNA.1.CDS.1 [Saccharomyces cerevisiae]|nr:BDM_1a_G0044610.mRNA.1.CDS.1 [Saccharomyces cerevisiae]CAI7299330.1 BDM_1a_G0044610.mRNA.1.CDS.1 [Saccharomyces cerevisiae]
MRGKVKERHVGFKGSVILKQHRCNWNIKRLNMIPRTRTLLQSKIPITRYFARCWVPRVRYNVCRTLPAAALHTNIIAHNEVKKDDKKVHLGSFKVDKPKMMIAFTCKKCNTRSSHTMSKQAYEKGTVLISCPHCKVRHLIADHLKIFHDHHVTVEQLMKANGEQVSQDVGDLEFEDIPDSLKDVLGKYAKNNSENASQLPHPSQK